MGEQMRRILRRKRHEVLPERPKIMCWDLDGLLIGNGKENLSEPALQGLWTDGFTNVVTTASPADYAEAELRKRELHHYINQVYGEILSGEGKMYLPVAANAGLHPVEHCSNLVVIGNSMGDIPVDISAVFILSDNPEKVAKLIRTIDAKSGFLEGYFGSEPACFVKTAHSRSYDNVKIPVFADKTFLEYLTKTH